MAASKIPSTFQLMGKTYTVSIINKADWADLDSWGECCPATNEIKLLNLPNKETIEQTFYHELTHAILFALNHKLTRNETFVDQFGSMLQQYVKTAK